ncbi:MAG TPA: YHS domain-containing protein [Anaerolineales bacterium]|nr:YHS domain-containing protein [Anaerolineales bacterium]
MTSLTHSQGPELNIACGGTLDDPADYASAEYQGRLYCFCTHACLRAFEQDPDAFMAGEIQHTIAGG